MVHGWVWNLVSVFAPFCCGDKTGMPNTSTLRNVILCCREILGQRRHRWKDDIKMHPEITGSKIFSGLDRLEICVYGRGVETVGPINR